MITRDDLGPAVLDACPSFATSYQEACDDECADLHYVVMGRLASHFLKLHQQGTEDEYPAVAALIERLHTDGDDYVREAATIGLLESIQNHWEANASDPKYFRAYLKPESRKWWDSLTKFWQKEIPYVGADLQPNKRRTTRRSRQSRRSAFCSRSLRSSM